MRAGMGIWGVDVEGLEEPWRRLGKGGGQAIWRMCLDMRSLRKEILASEVVTASDERVLGDRTKEIDWVSRNVFLRRHCCLPSPPLLQ